MSLAPTVLAVVVGLPDVSALAWAGASAAHRDAESNPATSTEMDLVERRRGVVV